MVGNRQLIFMDKKNILAFVPVLHEGYRRFFEKHTSSKTLYILGNELIREFPHLLKEIRSLDPALVKKSVEAWRLFEQVVIADRSILEQLREASFGLIMPDEDVMHELKDKHLQDAEIEFDSVFLRWDKHNTVAESAISPDHKISNKSFDQNMLCFTDREAKKSSDWWRQ